MDKVKNVQQYLSEGQRCHRYFDAELDSHFRENDSRVFRHERFWRVDRDARTPPCYGGVKIIAWISRTASRCRRRHSIASLMISPTRA
jgi:hypothetical protein